MVIRRAKALAALDIAIRQHLPETLAQHCRLGNVREDTLVFLVEDPVWKARLRVQAETLLAAAAAAGIPARNATVKVVDSTSETRIDVPPPRISARTRSALRLTAESLDDPELKAAMLALASLPGP